MVKVLGKTDSGDSVSRKVGRTVAAKYSWLAEKKETNPARRRHRQGGQTLLNSRKGGRVGESERIESATEGISEDQQGKGRSAA